MMLCKRVLTLLLSLSLIGLSCGPAQAAMISNHQILNTAAPDNEKNALLQTLARADVQAQMSKLGVDSADIVSRVNQMTQQEIAQLNQKMADLPAGSGVLGVILVVFIVLVITDIIGATNVFSFVHQVD